MKRIAPSKRQWVRLAMLSALLALVLAAIAPLQTTYADDPVGIDVIVTNDGKTFKAPPANARLSRPNPGSGITTFDESTEAPRTGKVMQFGNQTETVIVPDGRTLVGNTSKFPNRAIANLVMTFPGGDYICTGWFIGPDTLATAGHCVFDPDSKQFASAITVYPGRSGNTLPYGQAQAIQLFTNNCWVTKQDPKCDYGGIKINKNKGNQTGWLGFGWTGNNNELLNRKLSVRGYPGDKGGTTQWTMKGPIKVVTNKQIGYPIDTAGGQSGSPIFGKPFFAGTACQNCSAGIHAYGFNEAEPKAPFYSRNSGTRITQKVFNALCSWRGGC